ncbi:MAG TPA: hypothetical protein VL401_00355 [Alphaproteobacteria bacterium]|jgi:hypothetical protein|nr:hypothetical protein [Alphaproteobacteria bacterium]
MNLFDCYIAVDWSAKNVPSPAKPSKDALWVGEKDTLNNTQKESYFRTRFECLKYLRELLIENIKSNKRTIIGFDLDFGFPAGLVNSLNLKTDKPKWLQLWEKLNQMVSDDEFNTNNRFEVANKLNELCIENIANLGPLWGHPMNQKHSYLNPKSSVYPFKTKTGDLLRKLRWTEMRENKAQPVWKLIGSASVGGQTIIGIPAIYKLRFDPLIYKYSKIWPFETGFSSVVNPIGEPSVLFVEIWPGILNDKLDSKIPIRDQAQVKATVDWMAELDGKDELKNLLSIPKDLDVVAQKHCIEEEGWVLGMGSMVSNHDKNLNFGFL